MEPISVITKGRQHIAAGSLEVIGLVIKGEVVRVTRCRAGAMRVCMAAKLTLHHAAGLLGTTGVGDTVDCPSSAIAHTQALTFLTIPELFAAVPIASLVIASTGCWRYALVAIEDQTIITLAPLLAHSVTGKREREAGAGGRTSGSTDFIMAV